MILTVGLKIAGMFEFLMFYILCVTLGAQLMQIIFNRNRIYTSKIRVSPSREERISACGYRYTKFQLIFKSSTEKSTEFQLQ